MQAASPRIDAAFKDTKCKQYTNATFHLEHEVLLLRSDHLSLELQAGHALAAKAAASLETNVCQQNVCRPSKHEHMGFAGLDARCYGRAATYRPAS